MNLSRMCNYCFHGSADCAWTSFRDMVLILECWALVHRLAQKAGWDPRRALQSYCIHEWHASLELFQWLPSFYKRPKWCQQRQRGGRRATQCLTHSYKDKGSLRMKTVLGANILSQTPNWWLQDYNPVKKKAKKDYSSAALISDLIPDLPWTC